MPTGYTHKIKPGASVSFPEFAMDCARAFDACVTLCDGPGGGEKIPEEFKADTWHAERAAADRKELARLSSLTPSEVLVESERLRRVAVGDHLRRAQEVKDQRAAYEDMLAKVRQWTPPSAEHDGLKSFMVEQIDSSIKFDCFVSEEPTWPSPEDWHEKAIERARNSIAYHEREQAKEIERASGRTEWVRKLRQSLQDKP